MSVGEYQGGRNPEIEELLKELGRMLKTFCPSGWGFSLLLFEFDNAEGSSFYISSANREDFLRSLEIFMRQNGYYITAPASKTSPERN